MIVRVKICGITRADDAVVSVEAGVHAIGLVFAPSPRMLTIPQARTILDRLPPLFPVVGVFKDQPAEFVNEVVSRCPLAYLQFHGNEDPAYCSAFQRPIIRAFPLASFSDLDGVRAFHRACPQALILADSARGGSGSACNWEIARTLAAEVPLILAGGLHPENVAQAIEEVSPAAVDVSSGVELSPGVKDPVRIRAFLRSCS